MILHGRTTAVIVNVQDLAPLAIPIEERNDTIEGATEVTALVTKEDTQGLEVRFDLILMIRYLQDIIQGHPFLQGRREEGGMRIGTVVLDQEEDAGIIVLIEEGEEEEAENRVAVMDIIVKT